MKLDAKKLKQLKSDDPWERRDAIEELGRTGIDDVVPYLITALSDENPGVQQASVDALIGLGTLAVINAVTPLLRDERNAPLRNMAVEVLGRVGSKDLDSVSHLLKDNDMDIRRFAADIVGTIGDKRGVPPLIAALKDENPNVRSSAANSLGLIGEKAAIMPLINSLEDEKDEWVIFSIIEALGKVGDKRIIEHLTPFLEGESELLVIATVEALKRFNVPIVAATLIQLLQHANEGVRGEVLKTLVDMLASCLDCFPRKSMIKTLSDQLLSSLASDDEEITFAAVKGLGIIKEKDAVKRLIKLLKGLENEEKIRLIYDALLQISDEDALINAVISYQSETPIPVIDLLGEMKSKKAAGHLIDIFENADRERKRAIALALGSIGGLDALDFLAEALEEESGYVRQEAAEALSKIGNKRAIPCLFMRLERERYDDVRESLLQAIMKIAKMDAYNGLVTLICHKNPKIRETGVKGMGMLCDERSIPKLLSALNDEFPKVRRAAILALSAFKNPKVEDAISVSLMDGEPEVRIAAIQGLARVGSRKSVEVLTQLLKDSDMWVRSQVVEVLGDIGGKSAVSELMEVLNEDDNVMKMAAVRSLGKLKVESAIPKLEGMLAHCEDWDLGNEIMKAIEMIREQ